MLLNLFYFIIGLGLLSFGGDLLVRYAAILARSLGVRPLLVALTVVAFGTSAPELVTCFIAAVEPEKRDLVLGNIVGSNIANICLIMGLCAMVRSLQVSKQTWKRELMILVAVTAAFILIALNGLISRVDGLFLLVGLAAFMGFCFKIARDQKNEEPIVDEDLEAIARQKHEQHTRLRCSGMLVVALGMLVAGADRLVVGAVGIAEAFHVSKTFIGLTFMAIGTSLPELATSIAAVRQKETDIIVGNAIGSNIFNTLCVIGLVTLLYPLDVPGIVLKRDFLTMGGLTLLLIPFLYTGQRLRRREGAILMLIYVGYIYWAWSTGGVEMPQL